MQRSVELPFHPLPGSSTHSRPGKRDAQPSKSPLELETGKALLDHLAKRETPLSEAEVENVAAYIDSTKQTIAPPTYQSKDLRIGVRRGIDKGLRDESSTSQAASPDLTTKAAEHWDLATQADAFEFVQSDHRIEQMLREPHAWVRLSGIQRTFYHFQLYAAFWLVLNERGARRGAFLSDSMGLGKTTTTYLYVLLNYFLNENHQDVQTHPEKHLSPDLNFDSDLPRKSCPSAKNWPIVCCCIKGGVTERLGLTPRPGATLLLVPASLLGNWDHEWKRLGVSKEIDIELYIHHAHYPDRRVKQAHKEHVSLSHPGMTDEQDQQHQRSRKYHRPVVQQRAGRAHGFIILSTIPSYRSHVQAFFSGLRRPVESYTGNIWPTDSSDFTDGWAWARIIRDEAHLITGWTTQAYQIIRGLAANYWTPPNLLLLTGTPMLRHGPRDMLSGVRAINLMSPEISKHPQCAEFSQERQLDGLGKTHRNVCAGGASSETTERQSINLTTGRLLAGFAIRRRNDSIQNGKPLAELPPLEWFDVECPSTDQVLMRTVEHFVRSTVKAEWQRLCIEHEDSAHRGSSAPVCDLEFLLSNVLLARVIATVPELATLSDSKMLSWSYIQLQGWHSDPKSSFFFSNIKAILQTSSKLRTLRRLIKRLDVDADGDPEKLVVVSAFPCVCLIVLCLCLRLGLKCAWMHAQLDPVERENLAAAFQGRLEGSDTKTIDSCRIIVGTFAIMGQGITLHKANRLVLMEPGKHAAVEAQAAQRVHRIGSRTDRCWVYRLFNPHSTVEKLLMVAQEGQLHDQHIAEWLSPQDTDHRLGERTQDGEFVPSLLLGLSDVHKERVGLNDAVEEQEEGEGTIDM